jgi:hypothetical protein
MTKVGNLFCHHHYHHHLCLVGLDNEEPMISCRSSLPFVFWLVEEEAVDFVPSSSTSSTLPRAGYLLGFSDR